LSLKSQIKAVGLGLLDGLGVNALARRINQDRLTVLCYHGVIREDRSHDRFMHENTVSEAEFDAHLQLLASRFHPLSGQQVADAIQRKTPLPKHAALVTFDDGYKNNLTIAAPILQRYKIPAVFHVSTDHIETNRLLWPTEAVLRVLYWGEEAIESPQSGEVAIRVPTDGDGRRALAVKLKEQCKRLPTAQKDAYLDYLRKSPIPQEALEAEAVEFMNWEEVKALHRLGFEIGSHTVHHPILSRCDEEQLVRELTESKRTIEGHLQTECFSLAYPNGGREDYNESVQRMAREAGYRVAFVINDSLSRPGEDPFAISRICVPGHLPTATFAFMSSGAHLALGPRNGYAG
jgi:peptidoglycan/xylan/chitin deacetylase (PgdA/CDA1 family)